MIILTGMSGAGKSRAIAALEDIGYYCVDNLPPSLVPKFVELCSQSNQPLSRVAVVIDTRGAALYGDLSSLIQELKNQFSTRRLVFLDASDGELCRRYKETRRRHPLTDRAEGSVERAVRMEREILAPVKDIADYVIDTTHTDSRQLKEQFSGLFADDSSLVFSVNCVSFGFKYGVPTDTDLMFDVRCLPNPFYIDELRNLTGLTREIREFVMDCPQTRELLDRLYSLTDYLLPLYINEGKAQLSIAVGCTGGKHRSVVLAEALGQHIEALGTKVRFLHRDIKKT
ncbi:MAG: RNase adapter RapZ [Oscillospiraceae bacterium]|jgi:UPF0042 nucleotide-binding protein|nr:RNase adapter RapZ [Oscillospiraceae bacterium]